MEDDAANERAVNLISTQVAELAMDGTDLLAADLTSVDLDLSDSDAAFLRASLEWWDITSSCAENPKMYAAIHRAQARQR